MPQDGFQDVPRCSKRPQDRPKTAPSGHGASQGGPQDAKILEQIKKNNVLCLPASSLPMAFRGLKMASRWPKRASRGAQESPKTAPRGPERAQDGPERRRESPEMDLVRRGAPNQESGAFLGASSGPFGGHLGAILGPCRPFLGLGDRPGGASKEKCASPVKNRGQPQNGPHGFLGRFGRHPGFSRFK